MTRSTSPTKAFSNQTLLHTPFAQYLIDTDGDFVNAMHSHFSYFPSSLSGGCCGSTRKRTIVGGWAWAWWLVTDVQRLSLEVMTLNPMCESVETAQGVPLTVTGVAQCKIMKVGRVARPFE